MNREHFKEYLRKTRGPRPDRDRMIDALPPGADLFAAYRHWRDQLPEVQAERRLNTHLASLPITTCWRRRARPPSLAERFLARFFGSLAAA